jgi:glycyl-tRNA synthetase
LDDYAASFDIRNPDTNNEVTESQQFNLMFTSIDPTAQHPGQVFLNFSRLLEFNNGRIPFASAKIGRSFRNEISPRAGLFRVREFTWLKPSTTILS